ncbi:MAG: TrmO family methyltransferase domain-containing protein [Promethearchaeota archaeon]
MLEISEVKENKIYVNNVDILDKTPILDIKPYISQIDNVETSKIGWLEGKIKPKFS